MAREALELEEALGGQRVAGEELGELVDLARAEGHVDERELAEDLLLDRLRPAPADADDALGVAALQRGRLVEVGDEALVGLLADRAGVEEDEVGVAGVGRLGVAERLEHALHALRVVLVHLTAERRDVVALHATSQASQRAYSVARDSRMTVTLIWPGYSSSFSISRAMSRLSSTAGSSSTAVGSTMTRISRPACIA